MQYEKFYRCIVRFFYRKILERKSSLDVLWNIMRCVIYIAEYNGVKKNNFSQDNFGGDFSLNHYDELKAMSRLHQERNDDSVKELEAARVKEAHGSQVVAHLSEKVFYLKILKKELVEKMGWLEQHVAHTREKLNRVKIERDKARKEVGEIKEQTGKKHDSFCPIVSTYRHVTVNYNPSTYRHVTVNYNPRRNSRTLFPLFPGCNTMSSSVYRNDHFSRKNKKTKFICVFFVIYWRDV